MHRFADPDLALAFERPSERQPPCEIAQMALAAPARDAGTLTRPLAIALFNVKFSPNLGDGVIAECLEQELQAVSPHLTVRSVDLAGRHAFDPQNGQGRRRLIGVLEAMPDKVRAMLVPAMLKALVNLRLKPEWRRAIADCGAVVIGGGNLLADRDQNFPIKLAAALLLAAERRIPVGFAAVGVGSDWSPGGKRTFLAAMRRIDCLSCTVRDERARRNWHALLGNLHGKSGLLPPVGVVPDPGILAAERYGPVVAGGKRGAVGLCVTAPEVLRLHGGDHGGAGADWMCAFITALLDRGAKLVLFTNGSPEDQAFLDTLRAALPDHPALGFQDRFVEPAQLVGFIASLDGVIAHRLHACIVAHSYGLPTTGLAWDAKVESHFTSIGREQFFVRPGRHDPQAASAIAMASLGSAPDAAALARLKADCRVAIGNLAHALVRHGGAA